MMLPIAPLGSPKPPTISQSQVADDDEPTALDTADYNVRGPRDRDQASDHHDDMKIDR